MNASVHYQLCTVQFTDPRLTHLRSDQLFNGVYILPDWNLIPFLPFALDQFKQISCSVSLVITAVCSHFPHGCCQMTWRRFEFSGSSLYLPLQFESSRSDHSCQPVYSNKDKLHFPLLLTTGSVTFTKEILTATESDGWLWYYVGGLKSITRQ